VQSKVRPNAGKTLSVDFQPLDDFGQNKQSMDELVRPWHVLKIQSVLGKLLAIIDCGNQLTIPLVTHQMHRPALPFRVSALAHTERRVFFGKPVVTAMHNRCSHCVVVSSIRAAAVWSTA